VIRSADDPKGTSASPNSLLSSALHRLIAVACDEGALDLTMCSLKTAKRGPHGKVDSASRDQSPVVPPQQRCRKQGA
jgi:hypothetical protein